jgi:maleate isomerase
VNRNSFWEASLDIAKLTSMKRRDFISFGGVSLYGITTIDSLFKLFGEKNNWQPDGCGFFGRIGLLTPDFDPVPESEILAMSPRGISIHSSRVKYVRNNPSSFAESPNIDNATALLSGLNPKAVLYGFTGSSYTLGIQREQQLVERLQKLTNGIPLILTCKAAIEAFRVFNAQKIALIHPPWFSNEINSKGKSYFESQGFRVPFCNQLTPAREFSEVEPADLYQWIKKNVPRESDLIFIAGNGLRTAGAISKLESELKKPVITANQALLWAALRLFGEIPKVKNYGKLFDHQK